ncbi:MAG TPA: glycoside hydrolase family 44 protein [Planctomycetota bacterium]|nr:glycoside hydrolase family 44 protein [Planctomycetota bacterium]
MQRIRTVFFTLLLALSVRAADSATYTTDAGGFIPYWIALEPISISADEAKGGGLGVAYAGPEKDLQPIAGESMTYKEREYRWKHITVTPGTPMVDGEEIDGLTCNAVTYLVAYVSLDRDIPEGSIHWGSDDSGALYLNGVEVGRHVGGRGCAPDANFAQNAGFKKGLNVIVLKVLNETFGFGGTVRLRDGDGRVLAGVPLLAAPAGKAAPEKPWPLVETGQTAPKEEKKAAVAENVGRWKNVRNNIGNGNAAVWLMTALPGKDTVLAYLNQNGVWSSADGSRWTLLGAKDAEPIKNLPHQIIIDPANSNLFWTCGAYGLSVHKTTDGGKSFSRLADVMHASSLGVDFTDPERKTMVVGFHEISQRVCRTTDGGRKWYHIGKNLPKGTGFSHQVIVIDSKTYIVGCDPMWRKELTAGIFRTEDGGATWAKVSDFAPNNNALRHSDGTLYWPASGGFLIRSSDKGRTWSKVDAPVSASPIELPGGRVAALGKTMIYVSENKGATWKDTADTLPAGVMGIAYNEVRRAFFAWKQDAIYRFDVHEPAVSVTAKVDITGEGKAINPFIYGIAQAADDITREMGITVRRLGGNPTTPWNWKTNCTSSGADWYFVNTGGKGGPPETGWWAGFLQGNRRMGIEGYFTIPIMGRVAKDGYPVAFDIKKYPDQTSWVARDHPGNDYPDAGTGVQYVRDEKGEFVKGKDGNKVTRLIQPDVNDTSVEMTAKEQTRLLEFIIKDMKLGTAKDRGIKYIVLDNEPGLWHATHRGMHPEGCSYEELWSRTKEYASQLKEIDPDVKIAGPAAWGWTEYFYSGLDMQLVQSGKGTWKDPPDYAKNGRVPLLKWYMKKLAEHKKETGVSLVDILDVHFYPGANTNGRANDPAGMEAMIQETRVLWDPTFKDGSWMGAETGGVIRLIPMLKEWIAECNPGMQLAIGEYDWGHDHDAGRGVTQVEILGVFAREGLDFGFYWFCPGRNTPGYFGYRRFLIGKLRIEVHGQVRGLRAALVEQHQRHAAGSAVFVRMN